MTGKPLTGENVIDALLRNSGMTWGELCSEFAPNDIDGPYHFMALFYCVESLAEVDLISVDGVQKGNSLNFFSGVFVATFETMMGTRSRSFGRLHAGVRLTLLLGVTSAGMSHERQKTIFS